MKAVILQGDVLDRLRGLPSESVQCAVTSPPYWGLRDYGMDGQLGLERTPEEYIAKMVEVFAEVRRVLRNDGVLFLNVGDSYAGSWGNQGRKEERGTQRPINGPMMQNLQPYPIKQTNTGKIPEGSRLKPKDLVGIPWMLAFALRADGWYLRQDIIWSKPNPMPESVTDRCTKAHEYLFLMSKSQRYFYDAGAIAEACVADHPAGNNTHKGLTAYEGGDERHRTKQGLVAFAQKGGHGGPSTRNKRSVWEITTQPFPEAHFATFPEALVEPCILAGSKEGDTVLDPFGGSMTTGVVAVRYAREFIGIELNPAYAEMGRVRVNGEAPLFNTVEVRAKAHGKSHVTTPLTFVPYKVSL